MYILSMCRSTCSHSLQLLGMVTLALLVLQVVWSLSHSGSSVGEGGWWEEGNGGTCQGGCGQVSRACHAV